MYGSDATYGRRESCCCTHTPVSVDQAPYLCFLEPLTFKCVALTATNKCARILNIDAIITADRLTWEFCDSLALRSEASATISALSYGKVPFGSPELWPPALRLELADFVLVLRSRRSQSESHAFTSSVYLTSEVALVRHSSADFGGALVFSQPGPALSPAVNHRANQQRDVTLAISAALSSAHSALWYCEGQCKDHTGGKQVPLSSQTALYDGVFKDKIFVWKSAASPWVQ